jgi:hypothetical protein
MHLVLLLHLQVELFLMRLLLLEPELLLLPFYLAQKVVYPLEGLLVVLLEKFW